MEEKEKEKNTSKIEEISPDKIISYQNQSEKNKIKELNNQNIYEQYQKENIQSNIETKKESENKNQLNISQQNISNVNDTNGSNKNINNSGEKAKRHRRGKNEINERNYRCPDCDKCYLSGPALTTHRKTKHGYGNNGEKRNRGRPKKEGLNENSQNNPQNKFNCFFNDENRKPISLDQNINDKIINTDIIKEYLEKIFNQCKKELFKDIEQPENYSFYKLLMENWEKENPFSNPESFSALTKTGESSNKVQTFSLDQLFFLYLKEFSNKTNKDYFWFMIKFIVLFRECINTLRKNLVKKEDQSENNKLYTEIYNAETVPEICNDFFLEFMEPSSFFGLNKEELIELIQHFCYWLYLKQYTQSHLTLLDN